MKKKFLPLLLFSTFSISLHTLETFSINDKVDNATIASLFGVLQKLNNAYVKHGKISPEWLSHSTDFKNIMHGIKGNHKDFPIVPHPQLLNLPIITIDKTQEKPFHKALGNIEPMSQKLYNYDADLVKKIFYGLTHHHFVVVKHDEKHVIVFGTKCKNEALKSAQDTKQSIKLFKRKIPFRLKLKLAILMINS